MEKTILQIPQDLTAYFRLEVPAILDRITGEEQALWGIMTPHHMLEHLELVLQFATGKLTTTCITPEEQLPKFRAFLLSDYGLRRDLKPPFLPEKDTLPLKTDSLHAAKQLLLQTTEEFLQTIHHPDFRQATHPFFCELNTHEWLTFQYKHFTHHFMQFGLV
jgi:oxepin-CoA hydrolase/3-oxo-5,6-dehydrosuberyl-CoA semialdehyde dehydrogenase